MDTPDTHFIPSFSAFCRFAKSSVIKTTGGMIWFGFPRIGGCMNVIWALYHAVAFRIPVKIEVKIEDGIYTRITHTSVIPVIRCFALLSDNSCLSKDLQMRLRVQIQHIRSILVIEYPYSVFVGLHQGLQAVIEWKRTMSNFLKDCLQQNDRGFKKTGFHQVHLCKKYIRVWQDEMSIRKQFMCQGYVFE